MDEVKIIEIKQSVFKNNDEQAEHLRESLKRKRCIFTQLNVLSRFGKNNNT